MDDYAFDDSTSEVESLIFAAGGYVRPSEDLRPRVLEAVREHRDEMHARRRIWQAALILLLITALPSAIRGRLEREVASSVSASDGLSTYGGLQAAEVGAGWEAVDSLQETRRRQAVILRTSF